jgi:hypothetical protein
VTPSWFCRWNQLTSMLDKGEKQGEGRRDGHQKKFEGRSVTERRVG